MALTSGALPRRAVHVTLTDGPGARRRLRVDTRMKLSLPPAPRWLRSVASTPRRNFLLGMLPYLLVIVVVVFGSREAVRKRVGAPAALGRPYVRGERGT